jgi:hypothetical protein
MPASSAGRGEALDYLRAPGPSSGRSVPSIDNGAHFRGIGEQGTRPPAIVEPAADHSIPASPGQLQPLEASAIGEGSSTAAPFSSMINRQTRKS